MENLHSDQITNRAFQKHMHCLYTAKQKDLEAQEELKEVEEEIDKIAAELYGITDDELEVVKKTLRVLRGGEK